MMRSMAILGIIFIGLAGLILVQYRLLNTGLQLEKARMDEQMIQLLKEVDHNLGKDSNLVQLMLTLNDRPANGDTAGINSVQAKVHDKLTQLIDHLLQKEDLQLRYGFALTQGYQFSPALVERHFDAQEGKGYQQYSKLLKGGIPADCQCELFLHIQVQNVFALLLGNLAGIVWPTVLFVLLILSGAVALFGVAKRLKRLDDIKNDFINNLTHELKTPTFALQLLSKLLRVNLQENKVAASFEQLDRMDLEIKQLNTHIEKVLELASLEKGQYQLALEARNVHDLLGEIKGTCETMLQARQGRLYWNLAATKDLVKVDPSHFKNIVINLVDNAVKYADKRPEVGIGTQNKEGMLHIWVQDNGPGIESSHKKRIFQKFYRISSGNLHEVKGFGLGLSYVWHIVKMHSGTIHLESKIGEGSRFVIALPLGRDV
ncbi:MAG TPA: HAMP domain-containing sensor histidine kinase [Saprospiraceae bacterium]|nr:HAMP domain-containing sensor histidine kinase [Saprospiraceae bacterium]HMQ83585.1 HAMP domain-containing sensor histidine kinase [Saprospiraceae bacterium]